MLSEKKQRKTVLLGVLLLIGLFALGYIAINRFAFAIAGTNAALELPMAVEFPTTIDEYSVQDNYMTLHEAKVLFAEILFERAGLEFELSNLHIALFEDPLFLGSTWQGVTWGTDSNGEYHNIGITIDAETGKVVELIDNTMVAIDGYIITSMTISEPREMTFDIKDVTSSIPSHWEKEIRPYHLSVEEAAGLIARAIYDEFDTTLDEHTIIINFKDDPFDDREYWEGFISIEEGVCLEDYDIDIEGYGAYGISIIVNARTGEIINLVKSLGVG